MNIQRQLLVPALVAGLLSAALSGCGGAGTQPGGPATSRPTTKAQPAIPTNAYQVQSHVVSVLNGAKSVHVKGSYTWPHDKVTVNIGLLQSGQMAGLIDNDGLPMTVIDVGGKMYVKLTSAYAAYYHHKGCTPVCGKYEIYPRSRAAGLIRVVGAKSTLNYLTNMANDLLSNPIHTTFHGQPALQMMANGYDHPGAYIIVAATPECLPLEAVDPGLFRLTFSKWNSVPTPAAPPKSKIQKIHR
jgi:hypothetical protein